MKQAQIARCVMLFPAQYAVNESKSAEFSAGVNLQ